MLFKYKGYDSTGLKVKAKLEASNIEEAKAKLKAKSIFYTSLEKEQSLIFSNIYFKRVKTINLLELFLEFKDISSELMIGFKTDYPLKLVISNNDALIEGVVAPRLEEDEW